jgi:hypothetical protein
MGKVAADALPLGHRLRCGARRFRLHVVEADMFVHEIADRLDAGPTGFRGLEKSPGFLREKIGIAIPAPLQEHECLERQILNRVLLRVRKDGIGLAGIAEDAVCRQGRSRPPEPACAYTSCRSHPGSFRAARWGRSRDSPRAPGRRSANSGRSASRSWASAGGKLYRRRHPMLTRMPDARPRRVSSASPSKDARPVGEPEASIATPPVAGSVEIGVLRQIDGDAGAAQQARIHARQRQPGP